MGKPGTTTQNGYRFLMLSPGKHRLFIFFLLLGIASRANANTYTDTTSIFFVQDTAASPVYRTLNTAAVYERLQQLETAVKNDTSSTLLNAYALTLIYAGDYETAKNYLAHLEHTRPGLYATARNMSTAYELMGNTDSALFWTRKAQQIDPGAEDGSGWISLRILQVKQQLAEKADYLQWNSILSLDFGTGDLPRNTYNMNLVEIQKQLEFQLAARIPLVKAPDEITGQLLYDLGNITAITTNLRTALLHYQKAAAYGYADPILAMRTARAEGLDPEDLDKKAPDLKTSSTPLSRNTLIYLIGGIIAIAATAGVYFLLRKKSTA